MEDASSGRRRVLIVHSSDELYGADQVLLSLVESLDRTRFDPMVVLPTDLDYEGRLGDALRAAGVPVTTMGLAVLRRRYFRPLGIIRYLWRFVVSTLTLRRLIGRERIDLVHSFTTAVVPGAVAAHLTRTPHVWSAQEVIVHPRFLWRFTSWLLGRLSRRVVAVSQAMLDHLVAGSGRCADRGVVIHNGIDGSRFAIAPDRARRVRADLGITSEDRIVGSVGRIRPGKGQDVLLGAAARLDDSGARVHIVVAGEAVPGEEHSELELRELAAALGIDKTTLFLGFRQDVPSLLGAFDLFVSPSVHPESFGMTLIEAMASGTAVIATRLGATPEIVLDGITGLLVEAGDERGLAEAIHHLLTDDEKRQRLATAGRERALSLFDLERFAGAHARVYEAALSPEVAGG